MTINNGNVIHLWTLLLAMGMAIGIHQPCLAQIGNGWIPVEKFDSSRITRHVEVTDNGDVYIMTNWYGKSYPKDYEEYVYKYDKDQDTFHMVWTSLGRERISDKENLFLNIKSHGNSIWISSTTGLHVVHDGKTTSFSTCYDAKRNSITFTPASEASCDVITYRTLNPPVDGLWAIPVIQEWNSYGCETVYTGDDIRFIPSPALIAHGPNNSRLVLINARETTPSYSFRVGVESNTLTSIKGLKPSAKGEVTGAWYTDQKWIFLLPTNNRDNPNYMVQTDTAFNVIRIDSVPYVSSEEYTMRKTGNYIVVHSDSGVFLYCIDKNWSAWYSWQTLFKYYKGGSGGRDFMVSSEFDGRNIWICTSAGIIVYQPDITSVNREPSIGENRPLQIATDDLVDVSEICKIEMHPISVCDLSGRIVVLQPEMIDGKIRVSIAQLGRGVYSLSSPEGRRLVMRE